MKGGFEKTRKTMLYKENDRKERRKTMKKIIKWLSMGFFMFALCCICSINTQAAQAGQSVYTLKPGVTYTKYDITGDKKADKILIKKIWNKNWGCDSGMKVLINGKTAYSFSNDYYFDTSIKLYTLKNKKPFLYIYASADNYDGPVCGLFKYSSGKLKKVIDFQTLYKDGCHQYGQVIKINGDNLAVRGYAMSWAMASMEYEYTYKYVNGTLQRTSKTGKVISGAMKWQKLSWLTTRKNIDFYKNATSTKKISTIKKGTKLKVTHCYINGNTIMLKVKTKSGKIGWIKSPKKAFSDGKSYFKECMYAG